MSIGSCVNRRVFSLCSPSFIQKDGSAFDWNGTYLMMEDDMMIALIAMIDWLTLDELLIAWFGFKFMNELYFNP